MGEALTRLYNITLVARLFLFYWSVCDHNKKRVVNANKIVNKTVNKIVNKIVNKGSRERGW